MEPARVFNRWRGFQVIDPTVAWILSRIGPTIRRGHGFVSYCRTDWTCVLQDHSLVVVVSLTHYAAPLLYMSDKKSRNCCTGISDQCGPNEVNYLFSVLGETNSKGRAGGRILYFPESVRGNDKYKRVVIIPNPTQYTPRI